MNTPTNNVMDLISRLIGNPTGGGQPIATPSITQQPQGPMIQQQQQPQLQPNQNNPQAAQLLRILQQNPNLLNSLSGNQGNQAMSSNVPNDVLLHFLQSQLNNSGVQFRRQPQGMSNMAGGGMSMTPQQPQTQNTLMGSDNSTNNMLVGDGNFGTAPPTTSSVGMVGDNTMINNAMLGGLAGINSTTPLGMMTMNGTNMNIPNQPKRSGTPLSNNSGGLSTNTTTTTMTQSGFSNGTRKFSVDHIKLVQQLIEQCLKLYLSKTETMEFLCSRYDHIDPAFINLMWFKLEQQNPEFFKAYNTRLQIKDQITQFNQLVKDQAQQMQQQGLLIQNANSGFQMAMPNSQNMNNSPQIPLTISSNIPQSMNPYSSSPVTMNTFVTTPSNTPNMATTIGASTNMTNPMNMNTGGGGGFVYPNNLMNTSQSPNTAMVGGMQNQGSNSVSSLGNINLQQGTNTLNFAQQQNMYRSQTQPQTVTNSQQQLSQNNFSTPNNSSSPQKRTIDSMNISSTTTMGNTAYNEDHTATSNNTTFAGNSQPNMDTNQMINPRQVVQNFMKSPPVMIPASAAQAMMAPSTSNNPETISVNSNASNRQQVQNSNNTASNALQQGASANDSSLSSLNQQTATSNSATHNNQTSSQQDATSALDSSSFGGFDFPETGDLFGDTEDFDFNF
ncbi:hypothetical protein C9374_007227 [Naegleria lovaniensis]|uniref:Uncharacterized protein n=1 Tax=Naegleria lovaniensis TaxID=51637 RepID=A0AA88KRZ4_NAELO|nr:uncharacterized protein C9374_007227 [Naegleria lovaniensis]KAG2393696.1 hypothetical protein C9374_007227 [Naegleria lovaniensis]